MANAFLAAQSASVLGAYAAGMGVPPEAFGSGEFTLVERPGHAPWPYLAFVVRCPGGTVLSVAPDLFEFARSNLPVRPHHAARANFLRALAAEAERTRLGVYVHGPSVCWALGRHPTPRSLPAGLRFVHKDAAWMNALLDSGAFPNGAGGTGVNARDIRNRYAIAVEDREGAVVAVAGAFDTLGLTEIGIDVVPERQGEGLGVAAVAALTIEMLARGETPLYGCAADNIRSQRTAHAAGFVPLFADATIDG